MEFLSTQLLFLPFEENMIFTVDMQFEQRNIGREIFKECRCRDQITVCVSFDGFLDLVDKLPTSLRLAFGEEFILK